MIVKQLQYIDDHGQRRTVELQNTTTQLMGGWTNPDFVILEQDNQTVEYFTYLGGDLGIWQTKVHCNQRDLIGGGTPTVDFESRHINGHSNHGNSFQVRNYQNEVITITGLHFQMAHPNNPNEYAISFIVE